ncbi:MAG: type I polyketide synthase [Deltaproteobacteria bacterium]|nr:type I polyketide synthase [Deltaproteobacteria bacterium]
MKKRVAILGFSFRLPGTSTARFWSDLVNGRNLITNVDPERWSMEAFFHPNQNHKGASYTFTAGSIGDVSKFDADFFNISPREAALIDPQQRLMLELSWEALENSFIKPSTVRGSRCGVYIGISSLDYACRMMNDLAVIDSHFMSGNTSCIAANRISYFFDLRGPSMSVDTACSSSLMAFHLACRSIISGEVTQAFAGGVSLHLHPYGFIGFSKASMLSKQGRCSVFDASADGYVRAEGGGVFILKDYEQAVADNNRILAVVAASVTNTDGRKSGLTIPSAASQAVLLQDAYKQAAIDPEDIDYLEAHGTGTVVGDPIEARAIGESLGRRRLKGKPLLIGSVKSNLGHLEAASGVAGLVKTLYCIEHRLIPATINWNKPNPDINFSDWNIEVVTKNRPLKKIGKLVLGVNSFGFGGTNVHVILESHENHPIQTPELKKDWDLPVILSTKENKALKTAALEFADYLRTQPRKSFYDIAYTAAFRREWHKHRAVVFGATKESIVEALDGFVANIQENITVETGAVLDAPSGPAFVYSGNGCQWAGMGKRLLQESWLFKESVKKVDSLFMQYADYSLEEELAGKNGEGRYDYTEIAQPALFAIQVGVTQLLRSKGINPIVVVGHSVGEITAAWASGALSLESAVQVLYHRSQLQGKTKGKGQMTAVGLGSQAALELLNELKLSTILTLAGINSSKGATIAGPIDRLSDLEAVLTERGIFHKRLDLDYPFHCPVMDEIKNDFLRALPEVQTNKVVIPYYSTVTGNRLSGRELTNDYWWKNIRKPVLFEQAIMNILSKGINIFIEIGPHAVLRSYMNDCLKDRETDGRVISTIMRGNDDPRLIINAVSQAVIAGATMDLKSQFPQEGGFAQLPNYPWQRERHWHGITSESDGMLTRRQEHPLLGYRLPQHELVWENKLDTKIHPALEDHVVGDAVVFPGSGFVELALAAAMAWEPQESVEIENLEIRSPLLLSDDRSKIIRLKIEPQDGGFTVKGREFLSPEPWTLYAVGRILHEPSDILRQKESLSLPMRQPDFHDRDHEKLTRAVGLRYGPSFQAIDCGWLEGDSVLALFRIPEHLLAELDHMHIHPALLDCAFQLIIQLLKEESAMSDGLAFIPYKTGRIGFRAGQSRPCYASATLLQRTPRSITANFAIFDAEGRAIAVIKEVYFRGIQLSRKIEEQVQFLDCYRIPRPHILSPATGPAILFERIQETFSAMSRDSVLKEIHRVYIEELDPLLEVLCRGFTTPAVQQLTGNGGHLSSESLGAYKAANREIEPLIDCLLGNATSDQLLDAGDLGWNIISGQGSMPSAFEIWTALLRDYPDYFQIVFSVGRIGMHLQALLSGRLTLDQVLPHNSMLAALIWQSHGPGGRHQFCKALRDLITDALGRFPAGQRLGIIEVSEAAPLLAIDIFSSLDFTICDYLFASTSAKSIEDALRLKKQFPTVGTHLIDPENEQTDSAVADNLQVHLAVVTLDFTTLQDALRALDFACSKIVPGGCLIIVGHHPSRWIDFVFGGRHSWWLESTKGGWVSRQETARLWQDQLDRHGFSPSTIIDFSNIPASGPYFLLARAKKTKAVLLPAFETHKSNWLFLADENGYEDQLAKCLTKKLRSRGNFVVRLNPTDKSQLKSHIRAIKDSHGRIDHIVHLVGLNALTDNVDPPEMLLNQVTRCEQAAAIAQACEATLTKATCWLITAGALLDLLPARKQTNQHSSTVKFTDAALWGFGRTLMNEAAENIVRLVDIERPDEIEVVAFALDREFEQPDNEREIIITANGERYAPRLRYASNLFTQTETAKEIADPTLRLGFRTPGQLNNLVWEVHPRTLPNENEVEIEVYATGLNFRDVMFTLGLLSDEAVVNGLSGPTLGLEFSGVVISVGGNTNGFAPGDRVVGFSSSSFSNRLVTQSDSIMHLPAGISFESAATIPVAFLTAYYSLHHLAQLKEGEKVLIHGAAGGVGNAAIQVAKWCGAEIFATAGSEEKEDFLRLLGVDHILNSRSLDFSDIILEQTKGKGVDVVLNSLSGEAINRNFMVLKPFGRFLEIGKRDFYENMKIGLRPFRNNISYFGIDIDQLMLDRPDFTRRLFEEIMILFEKGVFHPLPYYTFNSEEIVEAFRYMQQAQHIGKIVVTYRNAIRNPQESLMASSKKLELSADATYLVTGGLSGFGLKTAEWLTIKGARNLALISRRGPTSEEAEQMITRLKQSGVNILAKPCDVTDPKALSELLEEIDHNFPPLKGIVHAAMVIDDGLVADINAERINQVLAPKVLGAQYLHEMTLTTTLDFFILFSSATTLFGNPGQSSYVAANIWLEALACYRRSVGLPATCVCFGAIDDVGYLSRNEKIKDALQGHMGGFALNSDVALNALERLLLTNQSGIGVLNFDCKVLRRFLPTFITPKFSELQSAADEGRADERETDKLQQLLAELPDSELLVVFSEMLKREIGEILRIPSDKIEVERSLQDVGMDSLMATEFVAAIESIFGIRLPVMALRDTPTIAKIAKRILKQLKGVEEAGRDTKDPGILQQVHELASRHMIEASAGDQASFAEDLQMEDRMYIRRMVH